MAKTNEKLEAIRAKVNNSFTEKGQAFADIIRALLDELQAMQEELSAEAVLTKVKEVVAEQEKELTPELEEAIVNVITKRMPKVLNSKSEYEMPAKVKNEIACAILRSANKVELQDSVNKILAKNDIAGLEFGDVIDFAIVENFGSHDKLFSKFYKTPVTKFFYTEQDLSVASLLAKQWNKSSVVEKAIQELNVTPKRITTAYIYKRQRLAFEDLDEIENAGQGTYFLQWLTDEIDKMLTNGIMLQVLVGDTINPVADRITTFESIGSQTTNTPFTTVLQTASATAELSDFRVLCDSVANPYSKEKVLVMNSKTFASIAQFRYAGDGDYTYRTTDEVAKQLGVSEIIFSELLDNNNDVLGVCLIPEGYWYNEKNARDVTYSKHEMNAFFVQRERNIGGAIHDLLSTAVLKKA